MSASTISERFNLLDDPWIPVADHQGRSKEISLLDVFRQAETYRGIEHPDSLATAAIYRLTLAFAHRAFDGPRSPGEAADWYERGFPMDRMEVYARKWIHRFHLFDPEFPFLQQTRIEREAFRDHWTRLNAARGRFNTNVLYRPELRTKRSTEGSTEGSIPSARAAVELVAHQAFALGGLIKRFVTSAKGSPVATAALTVVQGTSLRETLCLNLVTYSERHRAKDQPIWEAPALTVAGLEKGMSKVIVGLTSSYVWPARSVLLNQSENGEVESMFYAAGPSPKGERYLDPMVTLTKNSKGESYPLAFREDRALWRDLPSFVPDKGGGAGPEVIAHAHAVLADLDLLDTALTFSVFGMVNKKAKIKMVREETLRMPTFALEHPSLQAQLGDWVRQADSEAFRLKSALRVLARGLITYGENDPDKKDISAQMKTFQFEGRYWPVAELEFWAFVERLSTDTEQFESELAQRSQDWAKTLNDLVKSVYDEIVATLGRSAKTYRAADRGRLNLKKGFQK